jgi:hypothetical protein
MSSGQRKKDGRNGKQRPPHARSRGRRLTARSTKNTEGERHHLMRCNTFQPGCSSRSTRNEPSRYRLTRCNPSQPATAAGFEVREEGSLSPHAVQPFATIDHIERIDRKEVLFAAGSAEQKGQGNGASPATSWHPIQRIERGHAHRRKEGALKSPFEGGFRGMLSHSHSIAFDTARWHIRGGGGAIVVWSASNVAMSTPSEPEEPARVRTRSQASSSRLRASPSLCFFRAMPPPSHPRMLSYQAARISPCFCCHLMR